MGIRTVIILSILAMALGLMFLFIWIDQRRQQKRLRAIARYNRERQQQNRQENKGPRVVEMGNKRVIIDPLVAGFDDEWDEEEQGAETSRSDYAEDSSADTVVSEPRIVVTRNNFTTATVQRITPYSAMTKPPSNMSSSEPIDPIFTKNSSLHASLEDDTENQVEHSCCPHHHHHDIEEADYEYDEDEEALEENEPLEEESTQSPLPDYLTFSLMAEKGRPFGGYELLQAILGVGLRHGERQIFHRYAMNEPTKIIFSLASIAKPGTFSLESMGSFSTPGLIFIFEIERSPQLLNAFELMLETARQLSDELDGTLLDDRREPLTPERIQTLRQQLRQITPGHNYFDDN